MWEKPPENDYEFLLQHDVIERCLPKIGVELWQTLHCVVDSKSQHLSMWCALLEEGAVDRAIKRDRWDLSRGDGLPGFSQGWSEGNKVTTYNRFNSGSGVRPLVLFRSFGGAFPTYTELDEEFRLYHDLAEDKARNRLLTFDSSGRDIEVARVEPDRVEVQLPYLRQFQAGTGMYLAFFIESVRYSKLSMNSLTEDEVSCIKVEGLRRWARDIWEETERINTEDDFQTASRLLAKVILQPPLRDKAGIWPFATNDEKVKELEFIIGIDEDGNEVEHTSAPEKLNNNFNANPDAPHYLTPVYFRREVLRKYYDEPERYSVRDGRLVCLNLWSCQIDNDLESDVAVFLGDLGRDLPYEERIHWRQYNILSQGGLSETNVRRSFLTEWVQAKAADLTFRRQYVDFNNDWDKKHGWPLFISPVHGDSHLINTIRIPVTNSQPEFDEQISFLAKLLVDSLNEERLAKSIRTLSSHRQGISKFDDFLKATTFPERQSVIKWFRNLQTLRSTGSAHRKGSKYEKKIKELGIDPNQKPEFMRRLLMESTSVLGALHQYYCSNLHTESN